MNDKETTMTGFDVFLIYNVVLLIAAFFLILYLRHQRKTQRSNR